MKKYLIAGLFAAVGAVTFISQATARNDFCYYNPDAPQCQDDEPNGYPLPPDQGYGGGGYGPPIVDGGGYGGGTYPAVPGYPEPTYSPEPRVKPRPHHTYVDDGDGTDGFFFNDGSAYFGPTIHLQFGSSGRKSCQAIVDSLRRSGFRHVVPVDCAGRDYAFKASRDGRVLKIGVKSATGRISSIKPYY
jgi:hypothetical protein